MENTKIVKNAISEWTDFSDWSRPRTQFFCKIIGTNGYMKLNIGESKEPRGWSSYLFFKKGEEPSDERVSFDIQWLGWDNQPIDEPIHYDGVVIRRRELDEDVIMLETKKTKPLDKVTE